MEKKKLLISTLLLVIVLIIPTNIRANDKVLINDIIVNSEKYNEKIVKIEAEAIGESMIRGSFAWVNVNDGSNGIGIWMRKKDAEKISFFGNYRHKGDKVKIIGKYYNTCEEHGGESDIHATSVEIVSKGNVVLEKINISKILILIASIIVATILLLLIKKRRDDFKNNN